MGGILPVEQALWAAISAAVVDPNYAAREQPLGALPKLLRKMAVAAVVD